MTSPSRKLRNGASDVREASRTISKRFHERLVVIFAVKIKGPDNPTCYVFPKDVSSNVHTHVPCAPCMDAITEQVQRAFFIAGVANLLQPEPLINKTKQVRDILELSPSC